MDRRVLASFADEFAKISMASNVVAPLRIGGPTNVAVGSTPKSTFKPFNPKTVTGSKPTNYSIVHNQSPPAAYGSAGSTSKSLPPPPVKA